VSRFDDLGIVDYADHEHEFSRAERMRDEMAGDLYREMTAGEDDDTDYDYTDDEDDMDDVTLTFNTGRGYTAAGQRIAATRLPDGRLMFVDVDRMIDGVTLMSFDHGGWGMTDVMACYDSNAYRMPTGEQLLMTRQLREAALHAPETKPGVHGPARWVTL
jgi:hypothetical protein